MPADAVQEAIAALAKRIQDLEVDRPTVPFVPRGAPVTVVASDAGPLWAGFADYLCDGTADDVEIQAALDALPAVGGHVVLSEGTFHISATLTVPSNTVFELLGTLLLDNGVDSHILTNDDFGGTDTNIHIIGGIYSGNLANQTGDANHGIFLWGCSQSTIRNVQVTDCDGKGIVVKGGSQNQVFGAIVSACFGDGIYGEDSDYIKISSCHAVDNSVGGSGAGNGIFVVTSDYASIVGCAAAGAHRNGIFLGLSCRYGNITGCIGVGGDPWANLGLYRTEHCSIIGCISEGGANNGISVERTEGSIISHNSVTGADDYGIHVFAGDTFETHDTLIEGNTVLNTDNGVAFGRGIEVGGTAAGYQGNVYDTLISGNRIDNSHNYELRIHINCINVLVIGNNLQLGPASAHDGTISNSCTTLTIRHNLGYVTENRGASSIASGTTAIAVNHSLDITPTVINIMFAEQGTNDYGRWWVDTIGATQFTLNVAVDPGASNLDFAWEAKYR